MSRNLRTVCLLGFMGSGKSSVGKCLADMLGASFADLDDLVVEREGRSIPDLFRDGEEAFRKAEFSALEEYLSAGEDRPRVLALGGGTVCWEPSRRLLFSGAAETVYLHAALSTIMERLGSEDASRPLYARASELYYARQNLYEAARLRVDTDGKGVKDVAREIRDMLCA